MIELGVLKTRSRDRVLLNHLYPLETHARGDAIRRGETARLWEE
jgi:hypothetical protein